MGSKAFSTFRSDLSYELGNIGTTEGGSYPDSTLNQWINTAYLKVTSRERLPSGKKLRFPTLDERDASSSTTEGVSYLALPDDCLTIYRVVKYDAVNSVDLTYIDLAEYLSCADIETQGEPSEWTRYGTLIRFRPVPDDVYPIRIYYRKRPAALVSEGAVTEIGPEWDEIILKQAVVDSLMRLKRYEEASAEKKELFQMMDDLADIYLSEQKSRDLRVVPDMSYLKVPY